MIGAMSMFRRFLAGLFMALCSSAFAQVLEYSISGYQTEIGWHSTKLSACDAWGPAFVTRMGPTTGVVSTNSITSYTSSCTWKFNTMHGTTTNYNGSYVTREVTCTVGASKVLTFGVGWSATGEDDPNEGTWGNPPMSWCDGSCMFSFNDLLAVYMDEEVSANGYYEITATSEYIGTGATCTTPSEPPENPDPEPPCGDGNCTPGDGDGDGPGDGDGGGDPGDGDGDGDDGDTPGGENPGDGAGGDGDGDGENPGDDGPGGGTGPGGDGEGEDEGGGECGIPGKPPCAVKLDETGTPTGSGAFDGVSSDGIGDALEGVKGSIQGVIDRDDTPNWTWTFQLPSGCTPLQLSGYNLSIDVCQWQGIIHDIMSMLWVAATFWFLISMFTKAGD